MASPSRIDHSVDDRVRGVVRLLLSLADLRPADLADQIGMTRAQVWDRQRGDKPWTVAEVAALASFFGVPVEALFAGPAALIATPPAAAGGSTRQRRRGADAGADPAAISRRPIDAAVEGTSHRTSDGDVRDYRSKISPIRAVA